MLIQVDVDSTLYDADKLFAQISEEQGIKWPSRSYTWSQPDGIKKVDGSLCSREDLSRVFRKAHSTDHIMDNVPYKGAVDVLKGIAEDYEEVEIAYVSDRNAAQGKALRAWLEQEGFLTDPSQHVAVQLDKRDWMRERRPSIVIDDRVRTILMARYELDSYVVSLMHNHNKNLLNEADGIYIVPDWKGIDKVLREEIIPELQRNSLSRMTPLELVTV